MATTQVLIIGAGPTGLLLAGELARHGIAVRIVEKEKHRSSHSKALALHARSLEIFDDLGIIEPALARGNKSHGFNAFSNGKRIVHLGFDELPTPYPFTLILPQYDTEQLLEERGKSHGVTVERGVRLTEVHASESNVRATLEHTDGSTEEVSSGWLVACDGTHSSVRSQLGLPYEGEDLDANFALADVRVAWDWGKDESYVFFAPKGALAFVPLPGDGMWRLVASFSREQAPVDANLEFFQTLVRERCHVPTKISDPQWMTHFSVRPRKMKNFRDGRIFFAGDAAHSHSPAGGQGMNAGLQDAYNLAWKLALFVQGKTRKHVLESYNTEREPIAASLLHGTSAATKVVTLRHPIPQRLRDMLGAFVTDLEVVQERVTRNLGELNINYRHSPIVEEHRTSILLAGVTEDRSVEGPWVGDWKDFAMAPRAGERAPDAEIGSGRLFDRFRTHKHCLLLFDGKADTQAGYDLLSDIAETMERHYAEHVAVHVVTPQSEVPSGLRWNRSVLLDRDGTAHRTYGANAECLYLIRPDGYVGFRSQPADKARLRQFLESIFL